ncbi:MAG: zinc ribbon domain-containing protein [Aquificaceae bacterium]|nr:zinc ribbon domain-containing protein [Aquificaceae bacterium]
MRKVVPVVFLKALFQKPDGVPSRLYRNALEMAGQIVRSKIDRRRLFEYFSQDLSRIEKPEREVATKLCYSQGFVLNVKRQVQKLLKKGHKPDFFLANKPTFSGKVLITSADDSVHSGQLKKLRFERKGSLWFALCELKVPTSEGWKWIRVRKPCPKKVARMLSKGCEVQAPLIKRVELSSGYSVYRLVIPFQVPERKREEDHVRILALDLSPSEKRLAVGVVASQEGHSKPVFFKTELLRKIERLEVNISNLEKKIDRIGDSLHSTSLQKEKEKLKSRLKHLYQEQKLLWRKVRSLRKQILETFTNLVVEHARAYACTHIAIENLSFKEVPEWKSSKALRRFSQWFYSRVEEKLRYKASLEGIKLVKVNPHKTSSLCHKCGSQVKKEGLYLKCSCGTYDRDYVASVNIALKALSACHSKAEGYKFSATPGRIPFRRGMAGWRALLSVFSLSKLIAYLHVVYTSALKVDNLLRWSNLDKYGQEKWNGKFPW